MPASEKYAPPCPSLTAALGSCSGWPSRLAVKLAAGHARGRDLDHGPAEMAVDHEAGRAERHDLGRPAARHAARTRACLPFSMMVTRSAPISVK